MTFIWAKVEIEFAFKSMEKDYKLNIIILDLFSGVLHSVSLPHMHIPIHHCKIYISFYAVEDMNA